MCVLLLVLYIWVHALCFKETLVFLVSNSDVMFLFTSQMLCLLLPSNILSRKSEIWLILDLWWKLSHSSQPSVFYFILFLIYFWHSTFHSLPPYTLLLLHIPYLLPTAPHLYMDAPPSVTFTYWHLIHSVLCWGTFLLPLVSRCFYFTYVERNVVAPICNPNTWDTKQEDHSNFESSLEYWVPS